MKKAVLLATAFIVAAAFGLAGAVKAEMHEKTMVMEGYVIDTKCATANEADLAEFVKVHSKECALLPACAASGYNLYSMGQLWEFDEESSDKVHEFLMKPDSKTHVSVEMMHGKGNEIKLVNIENAM